MQNQYLFCITTKSENSEQTIFLWLEIQIWSRLHHQTLQKATVASGILVTVEISFRLNSQWIFPCIEIGHTIIKPRRIYRSLQVWGTREQMNAWVPEQPFSLYHTYVPFIQASTDLRPSFQIAAQLPAYINLVLLILQLNALMTQYQKPQYNCGTKSRHVYLHSIVFQVKDINWKIAIVRSTHQNIESNGVVNMLKFIIMTQL